MKQTSSFQVGCGWMSLSTVDTRGRCSLYYDIGACLLETLTIFFPPSTCITALPSSFPPHSQKQDTIGPCLLCVIFGICGELQELKVRLTLS